MQKVISVNVLKPMLLVARTKLKNKSTDIPKISLFARSTVDLRQQLIDDLEICCKNSGDVILSADELRMLYDLYED